MTEISSQQSNVSSQQRRREKLIRKKITALALSAVVSALYVPAGAQQSAKKIPRLGYLSANYLSAVRENVEGFQQGLRELG